MSIIGKNIKTLRLSKGWSLREMADKTGIAFSNIKRYEDEDGIKIPHTYLTDIATTFEVSLDDLVHKTLYIRVETNNDTLSGSEAVHGFCVWLTTRDKKTVMSSKDNTTPIAELVKEFCEVNQLSEPKHSWHLRLKHPES